MGKARNRRKEARRIDTHHIFPRSRCPELRVKANSEWNKIRVNARLHAQYHHLFGNKTPREILDFLLNVFWNGMIDPPQESQDG